MASLFEEMGPSHTHFGPECAHLSPSGRHHRQSREQADESRPMRQTGYDGSRKSLRLFFLTAHPLAPFIVKKIAPIVILPAN
jgi:hypothetical protein